MVIKANSLPPVLNEERIVLINELLLPPVNEVVTRQCQEPSHTIALNTAPFNKFGSLDWLFRELVRLYKEEGGWKYATVYCRRGHYFLYLSQSSPCRRLCWDLQGSVEGDSSEQWKAGSRQAPSFCTLGWGVALLVLVLLVFGWWLFK